MEYITVYLRRCAALSPRAARTLVGYALRRRGRAGWTTLSLEAFSGGGETLLIARPSAGVEVQLADYVFPAMRKYFTE